MHLYVNIGYFVVTIVSMILFAMAYKWKDSKYIFPGFALVALRMAIRLFDFEDSITFNDELKDSLFELVLYMCGITFFIYSFIIDFAYDLK